MSVSSSPRDVAVLTAAHNRRLCALDPDLGPVPVPDVERSRAVLLARDAVGVWNHHELDEADLTSLWGGRFQGLLTVRSRSAVAPDLGCLLDRFDLVRGEAEPGSDAEVVVRLPALEPGVAPVLLERGLRPASQTALLRLAPEAPSTAEGSVDAVGTRAAAPDDVDAVTVLLHEMQKSDVSWGSGYRRPTMTACLRRLAEEACAREGRTWIAEESGEAIDVVSLEGPEEAAWATGAASLQPAYYLSLMAVTANARRRGPGRRLAGIAHRAAAERGARARVLDHAAFSPFALRPAVGAGAGDDLVPLAVAAAGTVLLGTAGALAALLCAVRPRLSSLAWLPVLGALGVAQLGATLDLPDAVLRNAPLAQAGRAGSVWLVALAVVGVVLGAVVARRRDLVPGPSSGAA